MNDPIRNYTFSSQYFDEQDEEMQRRLDASYQRDATRMVRRWLSNPSASGSFTLFVGELSFLEEKDYQAMRAEAVAYLANLDPDLTPEMLDGWMRARRGRRATNPTFRDAENRPERPLTPNEIPLPRTSSAGPARMRTAPLQTAFAANEREDQELNRLMALPERMEGFGESQSPYCDQANAERLLFLYGPLNDNPNDQIRYCPQRKQWLVWDGSRWRWDDMLRVEALAARVVALIRQEAAVAPDDKTRGRLLAWATQSGMHGKLSAMIACAAARDEVKVAPNDLDQNPWLLNLENGTYDLENGEFRAPRKEDLITCMAPTPFTEEPDATGSFLKFMRETMGGPASGASGYLQRWLGYCLSGDTSEQRFGIFQGLTGTGKSTLLSIVSKVLGPDYAGTVNTRSLFKPNDRESQLDFNHVSSCRLVTVSETIEGRHLPEDFIKSLTGGERLSMRKMYKEAEEFQPRFKLILGTNFKPSIRESGSAIWRRMVFVPFPNQAADPELGLADKIVRLESAYVLRWLVAGFREWSQLSGPNRSAFAKPPLIIEKEMKEYRADQDVMMEYIEECFERGPFPDLPFSEIYVPYDPWRKAKLRAALNCNPGEEDPRRDQEPNEEQKHYARMSEKKFGTKLDNLGFFPKNPKTKARKGLKPRVISTTLFTK
jgi:P4 family phage/plasmid primase-like protien